MSFAADRQALPAEAGCRWPPPVWLTATVFVTLRLALAARLWLVQDEAYYALWATHLAPAYFDHPPMIALWIRIGEVLFGPTPLGVRLISVLGFAAVTPLTARIAWRLTESRETAAWAALLFNCMALPIALGFTATPDAPSTFFWAATLALLIEALEVEGGLWWPAAGLALALGVLSKLTNLFLGVALLLWLVGDPRGRRALRRPGPWLAAGLALTLLAPFLIWSARHHWLALAHQFARLSVPEVPENWTANFLAVVALSVTPLLLCLAALGAWRAGRHLRLLIWLAAPFLAYLLVHSLHDQVQANWLAPLFPGLAVLAATGVERAGRLPATVAAGSGLAVSALALGLALWPGQPLFPGDNPANQTKGWTDLTQQIMVLAGQTGARWIATADYGTTGALAFAQHALPVWSVTEPLRYGFRGSFPAALCTEPALLVTPAQMPQPDLVARLGPSYLLVRRSAGASLRSYRATFVTGLQGRVLGCL